MILNTLKAPMLQPLVCMSPVLVEIIGPLAAKPPCSTTLNQSFRGDTRGHDISLHMPMSCSLSATMRTP